MRVLVPEILDTLPPGHPHAAAARRDLRLINQVMGNHRWLARRILANLQPGDHIAELGAGDATLACMVQRGLTPGQSLTYHAIDTAPCPQGWPGDARFVWHTADLTASPVPATASIIVANLILHHFTDDALRDLGNRLAGARVILAREPARSRAWMRYFLYPFGLHPITRHDMRVSIQAGFTGNELPAALGLAPGKWRIACRTTLFNACALEAVRATPR